MLTTCTNDEVTSPDKNNDRSLEAVMHYILVHYEEKKIRRERRNTGPRMVNMALRLGFIILVIEQRWQSPRSCINLTHMMSLSQSRQIA
jgi:hypothetical protein